MWRSKLTAGLTGACPKTLIILDLEHHGKTFLSQALRRDRKNSLNGFPDDIHRTMLRLESHFHNKSHLEYTRNTTDQGQASFRLPTNRVRKSKTLLPSGIRKAKEKCNQINRERTAPKIPVENGTVRMHGDPASTAGAQEYGMLSRSDCEASRSGSWDDQMNLIVLVGCRCWKEREEKKHKRNDHHPCIGHPDRNGSFSVWYNPVHIPWL